MLQVGEIQGSYKASKVWETIRNKQDKVLWHKVAWGGLSIPRHSFISWLAIQNRLPTKDRLISWGCRLDSVCVLCGVADETKDHIYVDCSYSMILWSIFIHFHYSLKALYHHPKTLKE